MLNDEKRWTRYLSIVRFKKKSRFTRPTTRSQYNGKRDFLTFYQKPKSRSQILSSLPGRQRRTSLGSRLQKP